jgi:hypothetical protein
MTVNWQSVYPAVTENTAKIFEAIQKMIDTIFNEAYDNRIDLSKFNLD